MVKNKVDIQEPMPSLSIGVSISRQFLRSVRIDTDFGREDALSGYVCQGTAKALLESMATQIKETRQRAFTWTGPYGGGKSSLALMLCSLVGNSPTLRKKAKIILDVPSDSPINAAFSSKDEGWLVVPLVGKRTSVIDELRTTIASSSNTASKKKNKGHSDVIGELVSIAESHPQGVLLVIDELGKFLESAALEGDDVYFFQELAEAASRTNGRLIVVGILHQAFDAYAARLGRQARDDWAKVQGRYIDIPLVAGTDEVVELIGKAITVQPKVDFSGAEPFAKTIAEAIKQRRPGTHSEIGNALHKCWPLHPVVASLLGPISRRRFSQNERSTFGFLASREPLGFSEFLDGSPINWTSMYGPSRYWDYLTANLETAILASPDGHRWAVAVEAVERATAKGSSIHIELTKCVALIEMFRSGSGLLPEISVLSVCIQGAGATEVAAALKELVNWKILIERKHLEAFGVFAGSDFDIEAAVIQARTEIGTPNLQVLSALTDLQPILAKRLYHETGTLRWFSRKISRFENMQAEFESLQPITGSVGAFVLCLPDLGTPLTKARTEIKKFSSDYKNKNLIAGVPDNAERIAELSLELVACEHVFKTRTEIDGDSVARKELMARLTTVRSSLEDELAEAFTLCKWSWNGELLNDKKSSSVSWIASTVADVIYSKTPIIQNELVNRQDPSNNSKTARKALLYRMVSHQSTTNLGYEGFSADAGLYYSILQSTGIHSTNEQGQASFDEPNIQKRNERLFLMWEATKQYVFKDGRTIKLSQLYDFWINEPYGVRAGLLPILGMAFFLANRSTLALYIEGAFTSNISEAMIDEWLHDARRIEFRFVSASSDKKSYLNAVIESLPTEIKIASTNPLDVARALVGFIVSLPNWTRRTLSLSQDAQAIRGILLKANDPHKVLFADLPTILNAGSANDVKEKLSIIVREIQASYPITLKQVLATVMDALDQSDLNYESLNKRAKVIKGIAGEFMMEAFVVRLENFDGSPQAIESLISLGSSKAPNQWIDRDIDAALMQLATWSHDFRRAETLAPMRGRPSTRRALGVVFGGKRGEEVVASVDIDDRDSGTVSKLASRLVADLQAQPKDIALAALAEAGALLFNKSNLLERS
jgi:hypothetical protein